MRSFADVSHAQALERARAMVPMLRDRAPRAEAARRLLPETLAELNANGLLRFGQPKRWGGMEHDFVSLFDIPAELARGCASTAWNVGNLAIHHWLLALYDERAQRDVWSTNPDALIASGIAYAQGRARKTDSGFLIEGHWNFSSGVDGAHWNQLAVMVREGDKVIDHRMCLVPAADYEIIDDWQVLGMRGTGSKSVRIREAFVPEHRALCMVRARGSAEFPGASVNPNPTYRIPYAAMATHCIAGAAVGNAQGALELTLEAVKARNTNYTGASMRDFQAVQLRVAGAGARIDAARLLGRDNCREVERIVRADRVPTLEEKLRWKRDAAFLVGLCTEAVDMLHAMAGANGIYDRYPIERMFRDAHALAGHIGFAWDAQAWPWGLVALGGDYSLPTL